MTDIKILNELQKGVTMGMASLEEVSNKSEDKTFKNNLSYQYNLYQNALNTINKEFEKIGKIPEDTPITQKVMGWSGIQFNTMNDTSNSKLSELLIQGYDMGIIKGVKLLNENPQASQNVKNILNNFISLQENSIDQLKKFL